MYYNADPKPISAPKTKKGLKKKPRKATGEKEVFLEIWSERPHISEISGEPLGEEPNVWFFMHILSKKAYPRFRLYKKNIILGTADEHYSYDSGGNKPIETDKEVEGWNKLFEKKE